MAESCDDPEEKTDSRGSTTGPPRWVKLFGIVALVLVLLLLALLLVGDNHGPSRHLGGGPGSQPPSSSPETGAGHTPPAGGHTP